MFKFFYSLLTFLPIGCFAQIAISGTVLNHADTKPVANASVFFNNGKIGAKTADDGTFTLKNVKPGKYELIVSHIGFETDHQNISVNDEKIILPDIILLPKTMILNEVTVKVDRYRERNLNWFRNAFLGSSSNAKECKLLTPDVLDLSYDDKLNVLTASSNDFLEIENVALGYKIKYLLTNFVLNNKDFDSEEIHYEGYTLFEDLPDAVENKQWQAKRQETYENSSMHFLRSVLSNRITEEGFRVNRLAAITSANSKKSKPPKTRITLMPVALTKTEIMSSTAQKRTFTINGKEGSLYVTYNKDGHFHIPKINNHVFNINGFTSTDATVINFNVPNALFDSNGNLFNSNDLTFNGVWAKNRAADLLPMDYEPPENKNLQQDSTEIKSIIAKVKVFSIDHPIEKVYLHLDKTAYSFSDTIWYKAYTVVGPQHQLSALSGVLYTELISPNDTLVARQLLHLTTGIAWGGIPLAPTLKQGLYRIRAYTRFMQNAGPDYFYDQTIIIGGLPPVETPEKQTAYANPDLQFFPEGGELVNGIRSRVAFKVINMNGMGQDIKGTIEDNDGNIVADFVTEHLGMGVFSFTPLQGKSYTAKIAGPGKTGFTVALPKALEEGFSLTINNSQPDSIFVKVTANDKLFKEKPNASFYIIAQAGQEIYYTAESSLVGNVFTASIDKSRFPSGIVQFTLFNQEREPIAERIAFIQNADTIHVHISTAAKIYTIKQKVKINIETNDKNGNAVPCTFSAAVINESLTGIDEEAESTIINNLLLTADLKGHIEKPNYYFTNVNGKTKANLDLLMLTQGYRRFEWKKILTGTNLKITYLPQKSLQITGTLQTPAGKAVPNGSVTMISTKENLLMDTTTDTYGNFRFAGLNIPDTAIIVIRARKENKGANVNIRIDQPAYLAITKSKGTDIDISNMPPQPAEALHIAYIRYRQLKLEDSLTNGIRLKQVNIHDYRLKKPDLANSANLNGPGNADQIIMAGDLHLPCARLSDCLVGKLHGVRFSQPDGFGGLRKAYLTQFPLIKLNGLPPPAMVVIVDGAITQADHLDDVNASDIYSIEVLRSGGYLAIYGTNAPGGAIVITTRRGGEGSKAINDHPSGLISFVFKGYSPARLFYAPKYNITKTNETASDLRTTIYWKPDILTDENGKYSFEYHNNDTKGTYKVVVEGIDDYGNLGRQVYRYKVE